MNSLSMSDVTAILWMYREAVILILLTLGVIIAIVIWWTEVKYFFLNMRWGFPVLGRISRASSQAYDPKYDYAGTSFDTTEDELCEGFYKYYKPLIGKNSKYFECCQNYLNKTQQLGRHEKGAWLWVATFLLVAFEAVGFAYVLAPFINRNVSANVAGLLAWTIAIMVSIILVPLADQTGRQWHKNSLLKKIRTWHRGARGRKTAEALQGDDRIRIETTSIDDGPEIPKYVKMLSRIECGAHAEAEWKVTAFTLLLISAIAIGAYVVRSNTIAGLQNEEVNASPFSAAAAPARGSPFDLPQAATADNNAADKRTEADVAHAKVIAYKTTFVMLSVIFIGVQAFGIMIGFLYSLAGAQNVKASRYIGQFNNPKEFEEFYKQASDRVMRDAQAKLSALQQVLYRDDTGGNQRESTPRPTFPLFVQKKYTEDAQTDEIISKPPPARTYAPREAASQAPVAVPAPIPAAALAPAAVAVPPVVAAAPAPAPAGTPADPLEAKIHRLGNLLDRTDDELDLISSSTGIPADRLRRRRSLQQQIANAEEKPAI